jgi:hypothetical protein
MLYFILCINFVRGFKTYRKVSYWSINMIVKINFDDSYLRETSVSLHDVSGEVTVKGMLCSEYRCTLADIIHACATPTSSYSDVTNVTLLRFVPINEYNIFSDARTKPRLLTPRCHIFIRAKGARQSLINPRTARSFLVKT